MATLQSGKWFTVPTFFGMCCRSEWQERMYLYKWHEVDQTNHGNILCSYCLQWNTSQSKFRNHYFLFLFAFSILSQLFLIWGCKRTSSKEAFIGKSDSTYCAACILLVAFILLMLIYYLCIIMLIIFMWIRTDCWFPTQVFMKPKQVSEVLCCLLSVYRADKKHN